MKVAINGFGRIGKQFFLACMEQKVKWDFVINELGSLDYVVYSLKYDSTHPSPKVNIKHDENHIYFGSKKIRVYSIMDAEKLPWKAEKVDLVVDCTGMFTERENAEKHLKAGAKKVLISAPAKGNDCTIVCGVNEKAMKKTDTIVSAGSCTTNCVSPIVKILNDNFEVLNCYFVTTHAYTATQRLVDGQDKKDYRRGRSAAENIVPSTSGASQSVVESIPELKGKLSGYALRVPVKDGSFSSVIARVKRKTNAEEINKVFKKEANGRFRGVLEYTEDQIVSTDVIHNPHSCVFDSLVTSVNDDMVSVAGWYDNEWGYSNRLVKVAGLML